MVITFTLRASEIPNNNLLITLLFKHRAAFLVAYFMTLINYHHNNNTFVERHSAVASEALAEQVS